MALVQGILTAFQDFFAFVRLLQSAYISYRRVKRESWFQSLIRAQQRLNDAKDPGELKAAAQDIALILGGL